MCRRVCELMNGWLDNALTLVMEIREETLWALEYGKPEINSMLQLDFMLEISTFHALFLIAWVADGDSLMCCLVMMGRQIAKMFSTFTL